MKMRILKDVLVFGLVSLIAPAALADSNRTKVETVVLFNPDTPDTPESVTIDTHGNMFIGMAMTGEIRKIAVDGSQSSFAKLPIGTGKTELGFPVTVGGVALDEAQEFLYVNVVAQKAENKGLWRISLQTGEQKLVVSLPAAAFPNGLARRGDEFFAADSNMGIVWKLDPATGKAEKWLDHPLLKRDEKVQAPGPNGAEILQDILYIANSSTGGVIAVSIKSDGQPGDVRLHSQMATGLGCDDFSIDKAGNIYCTTDPTNLVVLIRPDGTNETLLTIKDELDGPTDTALSADEKKLFITNAAFPFFPTSRKRPSLMVYHLDAK